MDDRQGNPLVVATRRGRGQIALTLVGDTTRWQRADDPGAFAAYWSFVFSRLAAPATAGRWSLAESETGPVFVDHPQALRWTGPPEQRPPSPMVTDAANATETPVPLAQINPGELGVWQTTFWPRHPGWHRITDHANSAALDFYVDATADWPALQSARRRLATERFAALSGAAQTNPPVSPVTRPISPGAWFAVFLLAAVGLWTERRFATAAVNARP